MTPEQLKITFIIVSILFIIASIILIYAFKSVGFLFILILVGIIVGFLKAGTR